MFNRPHYRDRVFPVLVLKAYGEWRYSSTKCNLSSRWRWKVSFMLCYFLSRERASVDVLNTRLSIYHVNQQTELDMACCLFTDISLVQKQCLLDSKSLISFHLLHICPFFTRTTASIVNLKVHQGSVLCTSCVPDKVAINQKVKNNKWYSHKKKRTKLFKLCLRGLKFGGGVHWRGH